tara:strand:- start:455 stop:625 length:171 start_codon:yes stop_codon:yes gene_type:complete
MPERERAPESTPAIALLRVQLYVRQEESVKANEVLLMTHKKDQPNIRKSYQRPGNS